MENIGVKGKKFWKHFNRKGPKQKIERKRFKAETVLTFVAELDWDLPAADELKEQGWPAPGGWTSLFSRVHSGKA